MTVGVDGVRAFARYERALVEGGVAVLTELFWDDPRCVRHGVGDRQHGAGEIAAWRRAHPSVPPGRRLRETVNVAVDDRRAVVSTLFGYPDATEEGRRPNSGGVTLAGDSLRDPSERDDPVAPTAVASRSAGRPLR